MSEWFRKIPHPSYGNYCGRNNQNKWQDNVKPIDELDHSCRLHDWTGDDKLFLDLLSTKLKISSIYGHIYRAIAYIIFSIIVFCKKLTNHT